MKCVKVNIGLEPGYLLELKDSIEYFSVIES